MGKTVWNRPKAWSLALILMTSIMTVMLPKSAEASSADMRVPDGWCLKAESRGAGSGDVPNQSHGTNRNKAPKKPNEKLTQTFGESEIKYFSEEYLRYLINEFANNYSNWDDGIDGFRTRNPEEMKIFENQDNLFLEHEDGFTLEIVVDGGILNPKSKIINVYLEYIAYTYPQSAPTCQIGFVKTTQIRKSSGPLYIIYDTRTLSGEVNNAITISQEDFIRGVHGLMEATRVAKLESTTDDKGAEIRGGFFDAYAKEMDKKYPNFFITAVIEKPTVTPDDVIFSGEFAGDAYVVYATPKGSLVFWYGLPGQDSYQEKKIGNYSSAVQFQDTLCFLSTKELLLFDLKRFQEKKLPKPYKLQKNAVVVNGDSYIGWVGAKGELNYTVDGATVLVGDLPKGATFEFRKGLIAARYVDPKKPADEGQFWTIDPVGGASSVDQARYDEICAMPPATPL